MTHFRLEQGADGLQPVGLPAAGALPPGAVYFLPQADLRVQFELRITASASGTAPSCTFDVPTGGVVVEALQIGTDAYPDPSYGFVIHTSHDGFVTETGFEGEFSERGELVSATGTVVDRTAQYTMLGLESLAKLVRTIGGMRGEGGGTQACAAQEFEFAVTCPIAPAALTGTAALTPAPEGACPAYGAVRVALSRAGVSVKQGVLPAIQVEWAPLAGSRPAPAGERLAGPGAAPPARAVAHREYAGIVYRIPAWVRVTVRQDGLPVAAGTVALPQFGPLALAAFDEDDLRGDKKLVVGLHPGLGSLKTFQVTARPAPVEDVQKAVDAALSAAKAPQEGAQEALDAETARLEAETKRIEAEAALLEAKRQLEEARTKQEP